MIRKNDALFMKKRIIFIGGIHGVGKDRLSHDLANKLQIKYFSASEIIEGKKHIQNKKVIDIVENQRKLLEGLKILLNNSNPFILNGHFTLLSSERVIERVPLDIFKQIPLIGLLLKTEKIEIIQERLLHRDKIKYEKELFDEMQNEEIKYFNELRRELNLEGMIISEINIDRIIKELIQRGIIDEDPTRY